MWSLSLGQTDVAVLNACVCVCVHGGCVCVCVCRTMSDLDPG